MMASVLVSPQGYYEYEAARTAPCSAHYKHLKGEETSTNSVATIFSVVVRCAALGTSWRSDSERDLDTTSWRSPTSWSAPRSTPSRPAR